MFSSKFIYALLDEGSTATLVNSRIIKEIGVKSSKIDIAIKGVGSADACISEKVNLEISKPFLSFSLDNVLIINNLALPEQCVDSEIIELCTQRTGIRLNAYNQAPDLLIGQDHCKLIISHEFRVIQNNALYVSRCLLGCWSIHGNFYKNRHSVNVNTLNKSKTTYKNSFISRNNDEELDSLVRSYFDLESLGIINKTRISAEDKRALEILERTSLYKNNRWEAGLLWKSDDNTPTDGRSTALRRLKLLEQKLDRDEQYAKMYFYEMNRLINNGFVTSLRRDEY